jgi:hypothetical protein
MSQPVQFNPDRIAYTEAAGWRAYYDHNWLKMLYLLVVLCQEQFRIPFPISLLAGYYIVRASAGWVRADHDEKAILALHERFYKIAGRYSGLKFDPIKVAALEEQYWDVHRRLSGKPNKTEFIDTMIALHSAVFGISPTQARESAELRVLANNTVDLITSKTSTDPESDWHKLQDYLQQCYRSVQRELNKATAEVVHPTANRSSV